MWDADILFKTPYNVDVGIPFAIDNAYGYYKHISRVIKIGLESRGYCSSELLSH